MRNVARLVMVLLVDMAVKNRQVLIGHQDLDGLVAIAGCPIPFRRKVKQGSVRQHDDRRILVVLGKIGTKPLKLCIADLRTRIRDVVHCDEMHSLVIEREIGRPEEFLEGSATVERRVMLARKKTHVLDLELADDRPELGQAPAPLCGIVGGVGEVSREYDEFRLLFKGIDGRDRLFECVGGIRIRGPLIAPVGVRQLHEIQRVRPCAAPARHFRGDGPPRQCGKKHRAAASCGKLHEIPTMLHLHSPWVVPVVAFTSKYCPCHAILTGKLKYSPEKKNIPAGNNLSGFPVLRIRERFCTKGRRLTERTNRFEAMALPHLNSAFNLARWLVRDDSDAQDIVQDAYLRGLRYFDSFHGDDARPWLLGIVRNTCYTWLRARGQMAEIVEFDDERDSVGADAPSGNPEALLMRKQEAGRINGALECLSTVFREAIVLRELEGLSYTEIAVVTDVPIGTVMSRLSRARTLLRAALGGKDQGAS